MHPPLSSCRLRRVFTVLASLAMLPAVAAGPGVRAAAAQSAPTDPGTIVASDGRTFPSVTLPLLESPPFRGTGLLPEGARLARIEPNPDAVPITRGIESVIDTDERHQVTDTTVFPYRAIAFLLISSTGGSYSCTGFFISEDTVATAGHCVHGTELGGWATSITVYPGRNGDTLPYGSATSTMLYAPQEWIDSEDHRFDYGAIRIDSALGMTTGWLGYGVKLDEKLVKANVRIFGYPADKPFGTMWGTKRKIKGVAPEKLFYKIDTFGGQSGSPVYGKVSNSCPTCAFGIHAYGLGIEPFPGSNSATRVTDALFADLALWAMP
jgi:glutamyl endopeptidase